MCGIFGIMGLDPIDKKSLGVLIKHSMRRGVDSSGLLIFNSNRYETYRADFSLKELLTRAHTDGASTIFGHSRLITNGHHDNQPVIESGVYVFHNGIIVNEAAAWEMLDETPSLTIDTEIIARIASRLLARGLDLNVIAGEILKVCQGVVSCALVVPSLGEVCLFSNNGSLFYGNMNKCTYYSSEKYPLQKIGCNEIQQIFESKIFKIKRITNEICLTEFKKQRLNIVPGLILNDSDASYLRYRAHSLRRCSRCILPETMPFIEFNEDGVCNFCLNYKVAAPVHSKDRLYELVEPYRRKHGPECIIPFSGGRDSCYALHLVINELKLKPITYTYDWAMVTDLARRNISRMSSRLKVENIIVADDIQKKRQYIKENLRAWLRRPHLGMLNILMAGDKHFFRHIESIKQETGVSLNLWGINPLETTHFKSGFLGIPPYFSNHSVYRSGISSQIEYHIKRLGQMILNPAYFNKSLWDTYSGEYYRSIHKKTDYFHLFDFWRWNESTVNGVLSSYDWELAPDTDCTWRIGDGTAAFYNYVYYTVAGFTEHDTFRSNQIREGDLSRSEALTLVSRENAPRFANIKWYLDVLGLDFVDTINAVNRIQSMY